MSRLNISGNYLQSFISYYYSLMKHITTENFSEALTGNSLVIFHRLKGCPNCDKMLPLAEEFVKE